MATAYKGVRFAGRQVPTLVGVNKANFSFNIATQTGASTLGSSPGLIINDSIALVEIPNFAMLTDFYINCPSLDTSTGVVWGLGDNVSTAHGGLGAAGLLTGVVLGRSSAAGTVRAGGTGFVSAAIPWIYAIPYANVPVATSVGTGGVSAGIWLLMTITTAPTTTVTAGLITGWAEYTCLTSTTSASGTAPAAGAL